MWHHTTAKNLQTFEADVLFRVQGELPPPWNDSIWECTKPDREIKAKSPKLRFHLQAARPPHLVTGRNWVFRTLQLN